MFELLNQLDGFEASNKIKVMSGDDDLQKRDGIGERRRKHENRGLARAGIQYDDDDELQNDETTLDRVNDTNKDAAKAPKYSRTAPVVGVPETLVEGERHINYD
ncbi:hypothetical protein LXL04_007028 [Taraxacum kok-saghyz]